MVKKLYKYEMMALGRWILPSSLIVLAFSALTKILLTIDTDSKLFNIFSALSITFFVFSIIFMFVLALILVITRFYKNLLSHEGYITFSIPVSTDAHILCKLFCGILTMVYCAIILMLSVIIMGIGTVTISDVLYVLKQSLEMWQGYDKFMILHIFEVILLVLAFLPTAFLLYYACMAVGQQFKKNRIGGAVICFVIYYVASQILGLIGVVIGSAVGPSILEFIQGLSSYEPVIQAGVAIVFLWQCGWNCGLYFITRYFLKNRLNLE